MKKNHIFYFALILTIFSYISCEKNPSLDPDEDSETELTEEQVNLIKDSTYYYALVFNLWNESLTQPEEYKDNEPVLRTFSSRFSDADKLLDYLKAETPKIGPNNTAVDRYSIIDYTGQVSEEIGEGKHRDLGLSLQAFLVSQTSNEVGIFIRLVYKGSPGESSGLKRGHRILAIDGTTLDLTAGSDNSIQGNIDLVNKLYSGDVSTIKVNDLADGSTKDINIPATESYSIDPILVKKVFESESVGKKVGYLAYTSFVSVISSSAPNSFYNSLLNTFSEFQSEGVNELVVDLRYNGGGSTNAAELLTNLIVPSGHDGEIMYKYEMNSILTNAGWTDPSNSQAPFKPRYIAKEGSLNLSKVYFLVTNSSASASELVINALKPYMDVEIISTRNTGTYGKPVGSFGYPIVGGLADLYLISFGMLNADGEGRYYSGLSGTKRDAPDYLDEQLGDANEGMLATALNHIITGNYTSAQQQARAKRSSSKSNRAVDINSLNVSLDKNVQGLYNLEYRPTLN